MDTASPPLEDTLLALFSPPLDSTLVLAIARDYADSPDAERLATATLHQLQESALHEEVERVLQEWSVEEKEIEGADSATATSDSTLSTLGESSTTSSTPKTCNDVATSQQDELDMNLAFLQQLFPSLPLDVLRAQLDHCKSIPTENDDGLSVPDISSLLDELFTQEYYQSPDFFCDLDDDTISNKPIIPISALASPKSVAKRRRHQRKHRDQAAARGQQIVSLTDPRLADLTRSITAASTWSHTNGDDNQWNKLQNEATNIARLVKIEPEKVQSAWHKYDCKLALAVESILESLAATRQDTGSEFELQLVIDAHPQKSRAQCQKLLRMTDGDVTCAIELVEYMNNLASKHGSASWNALIHGPTAPIRPGLASNFKTPVMVHEGSTLRSSNPIPLVRIDPITQRWEKLPLRRYAPSSSAEDVIVTVDPDQSSLSDCLKLAQEYREKREVALKAATLAFQSARSHSGISGSGKRGVATYWAEESRNLEVKAKLWELRAARARVEERKFQDQLRESFKGNVKHHGHGDYASVVDLHGLTMNQALTITKEQVNVWWSSATSPSPLRIVTGAGRHSLNSKPILLPAISKLLDREGWKWKYDTPGTHGLHGAIIVKGLAATKLKPP